MKEIEIERDDYVFEFNYDDCVFMELDFNKLKYDDFFHSCMYKNMPCIIKNVSSTWECTRKWIDSDLINYDHFTDNYGDLEAPVADCNTVTYNAHCKSNMSVDDYVGYLRKSEREKLLYLKDWHLRKIRPNDEFYEVPFIFASDWLNEYALDHKEDDFMFVYIGPEKSWTPLHADVYNSYSWSVNIVGKKRWILFPPLEEEKLKDSLGNLPLLFEYEMSEGIKYFEIIQEQGDAIFVPSGWHHQVVNLLDTISINHNWINACNLELVFKALQNSLSSIENEIQEFKDTPEFYSQCQLILKSLFGMDVTSFMNFLCYIGNKRLGQIKSENNISFGKYKLGKKLIKLDLNSILNVINIIYSKPTFLNNYLSPNNIKDLLYIKKLIVQHPDINMS
ncbi:2-oxoglutarate and iron-dependent oxygenase JMJD4 [Achroia grisella]|uniref:2-oxoglutarate and iron-dependent oxygenase JMJD4 n=1 Tax=Achroia grisella TaxID=688607 RepID=UPI0027D210BA|nr:2-oxoglutarate and iron-dependent oxygenase JMJD4 [Achroia grisella]